MEEPKRWAERFARAGFLAKGIVYLIIGWLAFRAATGRGGDVTDSEGAIRSLLSATQGRILIGALSVGLAGYALWRFLEASADANRKGTDFKGIAARVGYALSGTIYGSLAIDAARMARRRAGGGGSAVVESLAGNALGWAVPLVGLGLIGYAIHQITKAFSGKLSERLNIGGASREVGGWVITVSRIGIAARAVVFFGVGVLLLRSPGMSASSAASTGTSDSLRWLSHLPQGQFVLAAVGAGLAAYGIYQLVHARYRRIALR
jgi:hypothetical protein